MKISTKNNANDLTPQTYEKGDVLFKEGDNIESCFLVIQGCVALTKKSKSRNTIAYIAKDNSLVGEDSILLKENLHVYSAVVLEKAQLLKISKDEILEVLNYHSAWVPNILKSLSEKVKLSVEIISEHNIQDNEFYNNYIINDEELAFIANVLN